MLRGWTSGAVSGVDDVGGCLSPFGLRSYQHRTRVFARSASGTVSTGRIRRSIVILSKTFCVLLGILVLFVLEENIREWVSLHVYLHQLRSQGEKLTLAELELPKVRDEKNGAASLMAAAADLHALSHTCPLASGGFVTMKLVAPGQARVLREQPALTGQGSNGLEQAYEWGELSRQLDRAAIPLQQCREALRQPSLDLDLDYSQGLSLPLPHLNEARNVARWLGSAALDNIHEGNLDEAVTNIVAIASLTRFQKNERLVVSQLVRKTIGEIGLTMTWEALKSPGWNDAQLTRLSEAWRAEHTFSDMVRVTEVARTLTLVDFDILRRQRSVRRELMANTFDVVWEYDQWVRNESRPLPGKIRLFLASELWRLLWSYQDECRALHYRETLLDTARKVEKRKSWAPVSLPPAINDSDGRSLGRARFYFSSMLAGPGSGQALLRLLSFASLRAMLCA